MNVVKIAQAAQLSGFSDKYIRNAMSAGKLTLASRWLMGRWRCRWTSWSRCFGKPTRDADLCTALGSRVLHTQTTVGHARSLRSRGLRGFHKNTVSAFENGVSGLSLLKAVQMCQAIGTTLAEVDMMARSRVAEEAEAEETV